MCALVAARLARPQTLRQRHAGPVLLLLWSSLRRVIARFARLAARAAPPDPRRPAPPHVAARAGAVVPRPRLPGGYGWVIRLLPGEGAALASQLQHLLAGPEAAALLRAAPQAARLLRPLCHSLAIAVPALTAPAFPAPAFPAPAFPAPAFPAGSPGPTRVSRPDGAAEGPAPAMPGASPPDRLAPDPAAEAAVDDAKTS